MLDLTRPEVEVLRCMGQGLTEGDTALRLYVSRATVDGRLSDARKRNGVTTYALMYEVGQLVARNSSTKPQSLRALFTPVSWLPAPKRCGPGRWVPMAVGRVFVAEEGA